MLYLVVTSMITFEGKHLNHNYIRIFLEVTILTISWVKHDYFSSVPNLLVQQTTSVYTD